MSTSELSGLRATTSGPVTVPSDVDMAKASERTANFMLGARKLMFDELQFASNELIERTQTEAHLFAEFLSKMASAHSVSNISTMYAECSKHQMEFLRRDFDRLFRHGERMVEATANLFRGNPPS